MIRRIRSKFAVDYWSKIEVVAVLFCVVFMISACASVNIDGARTLSKTGQSVAVQAQQNMMVSDKEYQRALDGEAFLHGYSGTTQLDTYKQLVTYYGDIEQELAKRSVVFEKLETLYDAFGELAGSDAGAQTEKALGDLGGAITEYAQQVRQPVPLSSDATAVISKIGGIAAAEIQKAKIKQASILISEKVDAFQQLLGNKLVREQMTGFRMLLASDRTAAFKKLWNAGVYDPKPLFDDFGTDAGVVAQNNIAALIKSDTKLDNALTEVVEKRLARNQFALIEKSYDLSLAALSHLVAEHKKLEKGEPLDLARLQTIVAELRDIVVLLGKAKSDTSSKK